MLTQKQKDFPYISIFKVSTGEEIICKVVGASPMTWTIEQPLCMVATQKGMQFAPFLMMADPKAQINISKSAVVANSDAVAELEGQYESVTTGIALPQKSSIVAPR
jgi:hypothetical protein